MASSSNSMTRGVMVELRKNSPDLSRVVEDVVKIEKRIFPKHESLARSFEEELRKKNCGFLYLELNGEVAGYVMFSWPSSLCASITKLAVKENCRRQGHGEALLKAAIHRCRSRNIQRICLHVDPLRTPAVNLYKKLGFRVDNLIEGYYSPDRNAYRMYLDFDAQLTPREINASTAGGPQTTVASRKLIPEHPDFIVIIKLCTLEEQESVGRATYSVESVLSVFRRQFVQLPAGPIMQPLRSHGVCFEFFGFWFCLLVVSLKCSVALAQLRHAVADPHWTYATATWYGSPEGDGSDGGACGYGNLVDVKPLKARVGAVSPVLFKNGEGCGACYKVRCIDRSMCSRRAVTVIVTDECPGGYCANGNTHFDLSGAAFGRMAVAGEGNQLRNRGEIPVVYRRTPCTYPGKNIAFHVNEGSTEYWLSLLVEFEGGDGDIGSMHIKEAGSSEWVPMKHIWGATWCIIRGPLRGPFSVKLTTLLTGRTLSARDVIPRNWTPKATYSSRLNFY